MMIRLSNMKTTIEINESDKLAFELIISELEKARKKHKESWFLMTKKQQLSLIVEESIEIIQEINNNDFDKAKIEAAQYAVTAVRFLSGV